MIRVQLEAYGRPVPGSEFEMPWPDMGERAAIDYMPSPDRMAAALEGSDLLMLWPDWLKVTIRRLPEPEPEPRRPAELEA